MRQRRRIAVHVLALLALQAGVARAEPGEGRLEPYEMVRSLQLVQDRIADGDHAALPMQRKLLELTDMRFRTANEDDFANPRNFDALLVYAMSGGNPDTVAASLARLEVEETDRAVGTGVLGYLSGDVAGAREAMAEIDPATYPPKVAAFLHLVKGSVLGGDDAQAAISELDHARLLGPGTLVEEAALRRTVSLAVTIGDGEKFMSASEQYARRFLRSPYSSQFAEAFVSGVIDLRQVVDLVRIEQAVDWMTHEQARVVYLRLARRAAIDGDRALLEFAAAKAREYPPSGDTELEDPRSELYSSISSVASETVDEVLEQLITLDTSQLSSGDRALLDAAKAVAREVVAPVSLTATPPLPREAAAGAGETAQSPQPPPAIATDELIASTRAKLEAIDKLLQETEQ